MLAPTAGGLWHIGAARDPQNLNTHLVFCESGDPWPHSKHLVADCGAELDWSTVTVEDMCPACLRTNVKAGRILPAPD